MKTETIKRVIFGIYDSIDRMIKESWREGLLKNVKGNVLEEAKYSFSTISINAR
ncbi:hypothetical protein [Cytobacillus sp. IB215665]|uniref:hypothetical protein n=1 Tax=Cytobacillus sp. IB215665 TaxID=3097357 RepID=UPI002A11EF22|nr:hypothetical protein [Cytobacillus sp. IB215665]MDX8368021.1 hypothetical protein [Cytobacillus sp. IB215665]